MLPLAWILCGQQINEDGVYSQRPQYLLHGEILIYQYDSVVPYKIPWMNQSMHPRAWIPWSHMHSVNQQRWVYSQIPQQLPGNVPYYSKFTSIQKP